MIDPTALNKKELIEFASAMFRDTNTLPPHWIAALINALLND